jgi:hypothetical protein
MEGIPEIILLSKKRTQKIKHSNAGLDGALNIPILPSSSSEHRIV